MKTTRILILFILLGTLGLLSACGGQPAAQTKSEDDSHMAAEADHADTTAGTMANMMTDTMTDTHSADGAASTDIHAGDTHADGDTGHDAMAGMVGMDHGVPEEAEVVSNPVAVTDASIAAGSLVFSTNCAACHGEAGHGDGPAAAALDPKPANLGADHVQANSDGALYWIITQGRTGTAMPPWESILSDQQRWEVVNFVRTIKE